MRRDNPWGLACVGTQRTNPASAPYERTTGTDPTPSLQKAAGARYTPVQKLDALHPSRSNTGVHLYILQQPILNFMNRSMHTCISGEMH